MHNVDFGGQVKGQGHKGQIQKESCKHDGIDKPLSVFAQILYKRKFLHASHFAILWSKVVSLFSGVQFFANL